MCAKKWTNHAERYMSMVQSFEAILSIYEREVPKHSRESDYPLPPYMSKMPYLHVHLRAWITKNKSLELHSRSGQLCLCLTKTGNKDDGRRNLPRAIVTCLRENRLEGEWRQEKVTVTWVVAYLDRLFPDCTAPGWEGFQLSHRCLGANRNEYCLVAGHLCWEPASVNQSRGYRLCFKRCHCGCGKTVCEANGMHDPICL